MKRFKKTIVLMFVILFFVPNILCHLINKLGELGVTTIVRSMVALERWANK